MIAAADAQIDWTCPVNWGAPLNRCLRGWWLCLPGVMGGKTWPDLCRLNAGVLTNMDPSTDWFGPRGRPGGYGCLDLDGTNDEIHIPAAAFGPMVGTKVVSASMWIYPDSFAGSYSSVFDCGNFGAGLKRDCSLFIESTTVGYVGVASTTGGSALTFSPAFSTGEWQHVVLTCDGITIAIYRNGVLCASTTSGIGPGITGLVMEVGGNPSTGGSQWDGAVDDLRLWSRGLSASDVTHLYTASRLYYPHELNRLRRGRELGGAVAAPFTADMAIDPEELYPRYDAPLYMPAF